eukprot:4854907-Prymnesium_polylepis.1
MAGALRAATVRTGAVASTGAAEARGAMGVSPSCSSLLRRAAERCEGGGTVGEGRRRGQRGIGRWAEVRRGGCAAGQAAAVAATASWAWAEAAAAAEEA